MSRRPYISEVGRIRSPAAREKRRIANAVYRVAHLEQILAQRAAYRIANPEKIRAGKAAYNATHREQIAISARAYWEAHHEEIRVRSAPRRAAYYIAHRDEMCRRNAVYRSTHREKARAASATRYAADPKRARAYQAAWDAMHPENKRENGARRRGAPVCAHLACLALGPVQLAWQVSQHRCYLCGAQLVEEARRGDPGHAHLDHVVPLARGGLHCAENLRPTCATCNHRKGARLVSELPWAMRT